MALLIQRIARGLTPALFSADRPTARRQTPDRIVLGVKPGIRPSERPPVRIFLGTERAQFRAEQTFLWSVEKHRDPSRIYEIYLLRDLAGFQRGFWLTGFTNYRFAIPEFAGLKGRAIYNDADQVYLTDPAELFDMPMDKSGFLSINNRDTSVMLVDCQRMAEVWNPHDVRRLSRKKLEARARQARLWGDLDDGWNARDSEYAAGRSKLVHFTTLHTQPWRPFPDQFVYYPNPTGQLWPDLEAEAVEAGFMPVSATRPSRDWGTVKLRLSSREDGTAIQSLISAQPPTRRRDSITVQGWLADVPDADVPWVLSRLFQSTDDLVINLSEPATNRRRYRRDRRFWLQQLELASRRQPDTRWTLNHKSGWLSASNDCGGPAADGDILVLMHRKPGHNQQARAIAESLAEQTGRQVREHRIESGEAAFLLGRLLGSMPRIPNLDQAAVIVAGGWLPTRVARRLQERRPKIRLILSGRKAGPPPEHGGVVIQCLHFGLPAAPTRLLSLLPLNCGGADRAGDNSAWESWIESPRRVAALIGGSSKSHRLTAQDARGLAKRASNWARENNARLLVITSRRSSMLISALREGLDEDDLLYEFKQDDPENPYRLALEHADQLLVTGESESMLADAASRNKGFLVWPLARKSSGLWPRLSQAIADKATRPRFNRRGSIRPQQGLTYLCARWIERNWVLPPRNTEVLLQTLYRNGLAAPFGQTAPSAFRPRRERDALVTQACEQLSIPVRPEQPNTETSVQLKLI